MGTDTAFQARTLVVVLGDQLDHASAAFDGFDASRDLIWMAEVAEESTHVWSSKQRIALFLSAMRHFADEARARGRRLEYVALDDAENTQTLSGELTRAIARCRPVRMVLVRPGDWRVLKALRATARAAGVPMELREDRHFLSTPQDFAKHARNRTQLRMEWWYREMRQRTGILMRDGQPVGGRWNFDTENRESFGRSGPGVLPTPLRFAPDDTTSAVLQLVERRFGAHPGRLGSFSWPVTRTQALAALDDFIEHRLPSFGRYQDALAEGRPWLHHSQLSAALNLKLLDPRELLAAVEAAWEAGRAPLASAEGFMRQVLGWREYVRGVYWLTMPEYAQRNALGATARLPAFFWTGGTDMRCLADALTQTLDHGYAHHIQRLMVTGNYALMLGVEPSQVHAWYLSVYVDAVEWVELPNTLGMSQYADGGALASKPYIATGKYLDRMGDHCGRCRYDPAQATGPEACPHTTLYWDFLARHEQRLAGNARMAMQLKNLARLSPQRREQIAQAAQAHREAVGAVAAGAVAAGAVAAIAPETAPSARPAAADALAQADLFGQPS